MKNKLYRFFRKLKIKFFPPKPLLSKEQHEAILWKARHMENQVEKITILLRCKPDEMLTKINKIVAHISEMQNTLINAHVSTLIDKVHKNCTKHDGPSCKRCEKCLDNECEKCQSVDWLRLSLGLESLLKKEKKNGTI